MTTSARDVTTNRTHDIRTMASSAFSFHCMICFEEFDNDENYPVVLPCGHTYVCVACALRLDKCMECRIPLAVACEVAPPLPGLETPGRDGAAATAGGADAQKENATNTSYADRVRNSPGYRRRHGHGPGRDDRSKRGGPVRPPPALKRRLPLPKNVVLLSLIQASEPARWGTEVEAPRTPRGEENEGATPVAGVVASSAPLRNSTMGSTPDDEAHKIRVGTHLEGGACGTYAVATKSGLLVYPSLFEHALPGEGGGDLDRDVEKLVRKHRARIGTPDGDRLAALAAAASEEADDDDGDTRLLTASLTVSDDEDGPEAEDDDRVDAVHARALPARRAVSSVHNAHTPLRDITGDEPPGPSRRHGGGGFVRHFSQGADPAPPRGEDGDARGDGTAVADDFNRPLIRLKYGDRVQVVGMDTRGWVKLARGHGYARLENGKQLVKVAGPTDKACQIEAMLHELSIERDRLKRDQTKLERLAAGLMIDLQSSLIASDADQIAVPAPRGSLRRSDSDSSLSLIGARLTLDSSSPNVSADDIDFSNRSRTRLMPRAIVAADDIDVSNRSRTRLASHSSGEGGSSVSQQPVREHPEIRASQSHSPGRTSAAPCSPPRGSICGHPYGSFAGPGAAGASPARVNFRTGMSGHRALTSSHSHPHDFIERQGGRRSMSHHAGISTTGSYAGSYAPHSSFWESPCAGGN